MERAYVHCDGAYGEGWSRMAHDRVGWCSCGLATQLCRGWANTAQVGNSVEEGRCGDLSLMDMPPLRSHAGILASFLTSVMMLEYAVYSAPCRSTVSLTGSRGIREVRAAGMGSAKRVKKNREGKCVDSPTHVLTRGRHGWGSMSRGI